MNSRLVGQQLNVFCTLVHLYNVVSQIIQNGGPPISFTYMSTFITVTFNTLYALQLQLQASMLLYADELKNVEFDLRN